MTKRFHILHADAAQRRLIGPLTPAYIIRAHYRELSKTLLWMSRYTEEDVDYDADFLLIEGVPIVVKRYVTQPPDYFTISVGCSRAQEAGYHPMHLPDILLGILELENGSVVWTNPELTEQV